MPYNLLLLPLIGGFCLVSRLYLTRYYVKRSNGYRLLLLSAIAALLLILIASFITPLALKLPLVELTFNKPHELLNIADPQQDTKVQVPLYYATLAQLTAATLALLLGMSLPSAINYLGRWRWFNWLSEQHGIDLAIKERADPLELLLSQALRQGWKLLFTLKNGKVYAGTLKRNFNPAYALTSVEVLVECSGYRKQEDHTVVLNTHYEDLINRTKQQIFNDLLTNASASVRADSSQDVVAVLDAAIKNIRQREPLFNPETATVIPVSEIVSVHPFDAQIYRSHMAINNNLGATTAT